MSELLESLLASAGPARLWETAAMVLAVAYVLLAARQSLWCWYCAFVSTAIYTVLFFDVSLLMDAALNVYYMAMAVYGWWQWRGGLGPVQELPISTLGWRAHAGVIGLVAGLSLGSGYWLSVSTQAAWPFLDSFTTWGAVVTTVMLARKILENWLYWILIDGVSVIIYLERGLYLTAGLFTAYTLIAVFAWHSWRRCLAGERLHACA